MGHTADKSGYHERLKRIGEITELTGKGLYVDALNLANASLTLLGKDVHDTIVKIILGEGYKSGWAEKVAGLG